MNKFILALLTLSSTLVGLDLQANESDVQSNEYYTLEDNWNRSEAYCYEEECPCKCTCLRIVAEVWRCF